MVVDEGASSVADYLQGRLTRSTGFPFLRRPVAERVTAASMIALELTDSLSYLGHEGYQLSVLSNRVGITATSPAGLFYGSQTLLQLLPEEIERNGPSVRTDWVIPKASIEDRPRFPWRGLHLDVSRHFMPKDFIKKLIDLIARYKLNIFHWHLTDDQGWRIEIKRHPKLTQVGAWRRENGQTYGGFYTQDDVHEIVDFAERRHVQIVPEIEMPGHCLAALAAYPELSCTGGPFDVAKTWGVFPDAYCAGNESTFAFLEDVLSEVLDLFPGMYVHIGGDECLPDRWKTCPRCQARRHALGLCTENELQGYFVGRVAAFIASHNRRAIGWDEIAEGSLPSNVAVMSWRGEMGGVEAARRGHDVVMTPESHCYFDHYQSPATGAEPAAIGGLTSLQDVYAYDPIPAGLTPEEKSHILGSQANLWTEYMTSPDHVEYMLLPRLLAFSEVLWSETNRRDEADFIARLPAHFRRLGTMGFRYRPLELDRA